jgi:hypothetical protein
MKALLIFSEKMKFISIEQRLFILRHSLNDSDESVLTVCVEKLLPLWLNYKENDLCKLLKELDGYLSAHAQKNVREHAAGQTVFRTRSSFK